MTPGETCRCCLAPFTLFEKPVRLTEDFARRFFEVTQIELKIPPSCPNPQICSTCDTKLKDFSEFRSELRRLHHQNIFENVLLLKTEVSDDDFEEKHSSNDQTTAIKSENDSDYETSEVAASSGKRKRRNTRSSSPSWFDCDICDKKYKWRHSLRNHKRVAHSKSTSEPQRLPTHNLCSICAKLVGGGRSGLDNHMLTAHTEDYFYFCDLCPKKTKTRKSLVKHMLSHISTEFRKQFLCSICSRLFTTKPSLDRHTLIIHTDAPGTFKCDCGLAFKTKEHLRYHFSRKHDLGSFECNECSKIFATKLRLDTHVKEFHVEKTPCKICGKLVRGHKMMVRHLKTHEGRAYKCNQEGCTKDFLSNEALQDHIAEKHRGLKTFICPTCGSAFATAKNLRKHVARQHNAVKVPCGVLGCSHSASRKSYLAAHYRAHKEIDEVSRNSLISALDNIKWFVW